MKDRTCFLIFAFAILGIYQVLLIGCKKKDGNNQAPTKPIPILSTMVVSNITQSTATCGGNVTSDGGNAVSVRGVCWSTNQNPTIFDNKTTDGVGAGSFTSNITVLKSSTTYYVKAYAINSYGIGYGGAILFVTQHGSDDTITDIDGSVYNTLKIGTQIWMAENLKVTKYRNGDLIGTTIPATLDISDESAPKYQWAYKGNESNVASYGRLYTWYVVKDSRGLCPTGWHVPSDAEWTILIDYLGGRDVAGGKIKEIGTSHWMSPNTGATNESGFTGLPSGCRFPDGGFWYYTGLGGWWSATETSNAGLAWGNETYYENSRVQIFSSDEKSGIAVRCVRDLIY